MSYPPSPPAIPYSPTPGDPRTPARRAGVLLIVLGAVLLLFGGCFVAALQALPAEDFEKALKMSGQPTDISTDVIRVAFSIVFGLIGVVGLILVVFGIFVRGGSIVWVVLSLILCILIELFLVLQLLSAIISPAPAQAKAMAFLMMIVPTALFGLAIQWLISAAKNADKVKQLTAMPYAPTTMYPPQGYYPPGYGQPMQGYQLPLPPQQQPPSGPQQPPANPPAP